MLISTFSFDSAFPVVRLYTEQIIMKFRVNKNDVNC